MKRAAIYIIILMIACAGAGLTTGILIEGGHNRQPPPRQKIKKRIDNIFSRIDRELNLTPEQKNKVRAVLENARAQIEKARDEFRRQTLDIRKEGILKISEILNSEQQKKFQKLISSMKGGEKDKK